MNDKTWGIYTLDGNPSPIFVVDSVQDLKYTAKVKVSTFPVEKGTFVNYNKVQEPDTTKIKILVSGKVRINKFITAIKKEMIQPNIYNIITPMNVYLNYTIEGFDFQQSASKGLDLLVVQVNLLEVREINTGQFTSVSIPSPKKPTSKAKETDGKKAVVKKGYVPKLSNLIGDFSGFSGRARSTAGGGEK